MITRRGLVTMLALVTSGVLIVAPVTSSAQADQVVQAAQILPPGPIPPLPLPGTPPVPDQDPFYRAPDSLDHYAPGTVLRSRRVSVLGLTSLLGSISADQLLFRSTDATGDPIAAVTTLLKPRLPAPGPPKVVSYQVFEDSLTTGCAPSYALRTNSGLGQPVENGLITTLLANGWYVLVPDHEGPRSEVAVGPIAGRITLDSIRAAENFGPAGLDGTRTPVGIMGYSGGSYPTVWANALASDYAPELNLVGAAAGGVGGDLEAILRGSGPPFFGVVLGVGVALDRAYPQFDFYELLNDRGRAQADRNGRDADGCGGFVYNAPLATVPTHTRFPDIDGLLAVPRVQEVMDKVNLVKGPTFTAPSLIVQAQQDELAFVGQVDDLVAANCRNHAIIEYQRLPGEHISLIPIYQTQSVRFFRNRFEGRAPRNTCP